MQVSAYLSNQFKIIWTTCRIERRQGSASSGSRGKCRASHNTVRSPGAGNGQEQRPRRRPARWGHRTLRSPPGRWPGTGRDCGRRRPRRRRRGHWRHGVGGGGRRGVCGGGVQRGADGGAEIWLNSRNAEGPVAVVQCKHALGNYRDLLEAITLNPAMGYYLNTKGNLKENSYGRQPDENYAREVMQLFTVGLYLLNPDGTLQLDGNGKPQDTYTASDVSNLARVFTGYDVDMSQNVNTVIAQIGGGTRTIPSTTYVRLPMKFNANNHSNLEVNFLGVTIPANTSGAAALKTALDTLFNHPNTAPFVCKQLIQRLVTSNPSPAYVGRVAAVFANNGQGVRGDLAYVFAAILLDNEARDASGLTGNEYGKLREPMLRLVQWVRTFGAGSKSGAWKIDDRSSPGGALAQSPLRSPSVFNFFRPGYVPPSTVAPPATGLSSGKVAPEFQIVNETSVGGYLNYMMQVIDSGINSGDIKAAYTSELALVLNPAALVDRLSLLLAGGQLSGSTKTIIVNALLAVNVTASSSDSVKRNRVCAAVLMVMACAEYLVQK